VDDVTIVINERPSMDVLCASSNRCEFFFVSELQLGLVGLGLGLELVLGLEFGLGCRMPIPGVRVWEECRYRNRREEQLR